MTEHRVPSGSPDLTEENIQKLKQLFPEILTDGEKIDFEKLKLIMGEEVEESKEHYQFTWHGKRETIRGAQIPSKGTLKVDKASSKNFDTTENLYIEGDNLEVLKLLQKSYNGKIKMIYIDPPYNTGKDFVYKDNFHDGVDHYLEMTGQKDEEGNRLTTNTDSSGRFHTDWLNMMYPRLKLAKNLLTEDGVIFISIDDNEVNNLKGICNEVFGESNFIALLPTVMNLKGNNDEFGFAGTHEYNLVFAKRKDKVVFNNLNIESLDELEEWQEDEIGMYKKGANLKATGTNAPRDKRPNLYYPIFINENDQISTKKKNDSDVALYPVTDGKEMSWRWQKSTMEKGILQGDVIVVKNGEDYSLYKKQRPELGNIPSRKPKSIFYKPTYSSGNGTNELKGLFGNRFFDNPKPLDLIKDFITITTQKGLILDLFSGSSTTAHATMQLNAEDGGNRKFIMVQLPEETEEKSEAYKAGYKNICEIGKERIRRAGEKIIQENPEVANTLDIGFKVLKLDKSNIREWNADFDDIERTLETFDEVFIPDAKEIDIVYEIMLKTGLELTLPINSFQVDGKNVYDIALGNLFICLDDQIDRDIAAAIIEKRRDYQIEVSTVVFKDAGFANNDSEKLNCFEMLKDAGYTDEQLMTI